MLLLRPRGKIYFSLRVSEWVDEPNQHHCSDPSSCAPQKTSVEEWPNTFTASSQGDSEFCLRALGQVLFLCGFPCLLVAYCPAYLHKGTTHRLLVCVPSTSSKARPNRCGTTVRPDLWLSLRVKSKICGAALRAIECL